jgi:hypothetical protein
MKMKALTLVNIILATVLLASIIIAGISTSTSESMHPYDPWYDLDDDGDIDIYDVVTICTHYDTEGTPINKTALLLELLERVDSLNASLVELQARFDMLQSVFLSGLVGYWKFDEGNGTIAHDSSNNNNTGTLVNGPFWVDGKYGKALNFDGSDDYVDCGTLGDFGSTTLNDTTTYMFWINTSQTTSSRILGTINDGYNTALAIEMNIPTTDKVRIYIRDDERHRLSADLENVFDFTGTGWHHFAFVVDVRNSSIVIYIDGISRAITYSHQEAPTTFSDFQYPFTIGAWNLWGDVQSFFNGTIDDIKIYNRTLDSIEIEAHYLGLLS